MKRLITGLLEIHGMFLYTERDGGGGVIDIKQKFGLNPQADLYPEPNLYPQSSVGGQILPEDYQSCWYEDGYTVKFGLIRCVYTAANDAKYEYLSYINGFAPYAGEQFETYDISDNYIVESLRLTEAQVIAICGIIRGNIEDVTYMPVKLVGRGLPYVQPGDTFEVLTATNDSITTIVLSRTLKGEMVMTDEYVSVS